MSAVLGDRVRDARLRFEELKMKPTGRTTKKKIYGWSERGHEVGSWCERRGCRAAGGTVAADWLPVKGTAEETRSVAVAQLGAFEEM